MNSNFKVGDRVECNVDSSSWAVFYQDGFKGPTLGDVLEIEELKYIRYTAMVGARFKEFPDEIFALCSFKPVDGQRVAYLKRAYKGKV